MRAKCAVVGEIESNRLAIRRDRSPSSEITAAASRISIVVAPSFLAECNKEVTTMACRPVSPGDAPDTGKVTGVLHPAERL